MTTKTILGLPINVPEKLMFLGEEQVYGLAHFYLDGEYGEVIENFSTATKNAFRLGGLVDEFHLAEIGVGSFEESSPENGFNFYEALKFKRATFAKKETPWASIRFIEVCGKIYVPEDESSYVEFVYDFQSALTCLVEPPPKSTMTLEETLKMCQDKLEHLRQSNN